MPHRWTVSNIKSVPFGNKWTISAPGIIINNPVASLMRTTINFVIEQIYNPRIVKYNPWCTSSTLMPKWDTFILLMVHLWIALSAKYDTTINLHPANLLCLIAFKNISNQIFNLSERFSQVSSGDFYNAPFNRSLL